MNVHTNKQYITMKRHHPLRAFYFPTSVFSSSIEGKWWRLLKGLKVTHERKKWGRFVRRIKGWIENRREKKCDALVLGWLVWIFNSFFSHYYFNYPWEVLKALMKKRGSVSKNLAEYFMLPFLFCLSHSWSIWLRQKCIW